MATLILAEAALAFAGLLDDALVYLVQSSGVLGHPVRRRVMSLLVDREIATREELVAMLSDDETLSEREVERLETMLHHDHLPRLEEELLVEYDDRNGDVVLRTDPAEARELLESTPKN
ncbi:hypothetical protein ACFQO4_11300 [Saliphagus sp. GCM10025334]